MTFYRTVKESDFGSPVATIESNRPGSLSGHLCLSTLRTAGFCGAERCWNFACVVVHQITCATVGARTLAMIIIFLITPLVWLALIAGRISAFAIVDGRDRELVCVFTLSDDGTVANLAVLNRSRFWRMVARIDLLHVSKLCAHSPKSVGTLRAVVKAGGPFSRVLLRAGFVQLAVQDSARRFKLRPPFPGARLYVTFATKFRLKEVFETWELTRD